MILKRPCCFTSRNSDSRRTIVFQELEAENYFELGYLEKMTGYIDKYKIRVGDYRIGITIDKETKTLICQRIAHPEKFTESFLEG